jgi:2-polyprenyl-3-methyl-5-hydroxy-6-metoxy-1,4-benzoquinol methylase
MAPCRVKKKREMNMIKRQEKDRGRSCNTIQDFGVQWQSYTRNTGYYGSTDSLIALFGNLLSAEDIREKHIADVGAGSGRYTRMFHALGAESILAVEPSSAIDILKRNTADLDRIDYLQATADAIPAQGFDWVFCIGVLQFIVDPAASLRAMGRALGAGGKLFLWVYGRENNEGYLRVVNPVRAISSKLPHVVLDPITGMLAILASGYALVCRFIRLPLSDYLNGYYSKLDFYSRKLIAYDQLNPKYAKYYRREELEALLRQNGFRDIRMYHYLNYSWSVTASFGGV